MAPKPVDGEIVAAVQEELQALTSSQLPQFGLRTELGAQIGEVQGTLQCLEALKEKAHLNRTTGVGVLGDWNRTVTTCEGRSRSATLEVWVSLISARIRQNDFNSTAMSQ